MSEIGSFYVDRRSPSGMSVVGVVVGRSAAGAGLLQPVSLCLCLWACLGRLPHLLPSSSKIRHNGYCAMSCSRQAVPPRDRETGHAGASWSNMEHQTNLKTLSVSIRNAKKGEKGQKTRLFTEKDKQ